MSLRRDPFFRKLKHAEMKALKTHHRISNCENYISNKVTPKGFKVNLRPNIGRVSTRFNSRWIDIVENCSQSLLHLCLSADRSQLARLERNIKNYKMHLATRLSKNDLHECQTLIFHYKRILSDKLTYTQNKKFFRDNIVPSSPDCLWQGQRRRISNVVPSPPDSLWQGQRRRITSTPSHKPKRRYRRDRNKRRTDTSRTPFESVETKRDVLNLSDHPLSPSEHSLLSKGLTFCPIPRDVNERRVREDVRAFFRRLRLKEYFSRPKGSRLSDIAEESSSDDEPEDVQNEYQPRPFVKKSTWEPGPSKCGALEAYIDAVQEGVEKLLNTDTVRPKDNLKKAERKALQNLKDNDAIVIKKADKGSTVVVLNKSDYIDEALRQLSSPSFYQKLDSDPTLEFSTLITSDLTDMKNNNEIDEDVYEYLCPENPRPGQFYLLPKIHKEGVPGRPIVSAIGHPTEKISQFLDYHLKDHVEKLPSYLKDTTDYIKKTPSKELPVGTLLVTMDVTSLYTNIPHEEGIAACRKVWDLRQIKRPSTESLVKLLEHTLKLNNFMFNGDHYLQINGTSMGTKMAPSYANIFMGDLEDRLLQQAPSKPLSWLRFIDDIEMKWTEGREKLDEFIEFTNKFHPSIKFTVEISDSSNVFLDTRSSLSEGNIHFDLHTKDTDSHLYLRTDSCHPPHVFKGIPKGLATRIRRICSSDESFQSRSRELSQRLCRRGYNAKSVNESISAVRSVDRDMLLQYKPKNTSSRIPLVTTFHPSLLGISAILKENLPTLHQSKRMKKCIPSPPLVSYRKPRSIKDHLVRSRLDNPMPVCSFSTCSNKRCKLCPKSQATSTFISTNTGHEYKILTNVSCKSKNVVYLITCRVCKKQYIGETEDGLNMRINNHRSSITTKKMHLPVAQHFNLDHHSWEDMIVVPIDHNSTWTTDQRVAKENFWQYTLKTIEPDGLNKRSDTLQLSRKY